MATYAFKSGIAVIINITEFDSSLGKPPRKKCDIDVSNLSQRCQEIGFETNICFDLSVNEIKETINEIKKNKEDLRNADCLLIVVTTYGKEERIYATDHEFDIKTVVEEFSSAKCPELASKPKIFIFEASKEQDPNEADCKGCLPDSNDAEAKGDLLDPNQSDAKGYLPKGPTADKSEYRPGVPETAEEILIAVTSFSESRKGEPFSGILAKALERLKVGEDIEMLLNGIKKEFVYMEMNINNQLRGKLVLKQN